MEGILESEITTKDSKVESSSMSRSGRGLSFWMSFLSLCVSLFLFALELTAVSTAIPTIVSALHTPDFVWIGSSYAIASAAGTPLAGNCAQVFGRRPTLVTAVVLFAIGSALSGAARDHSMIIAGRTIQGLGGGAIVAVGDILVGDLVPLKDRGLFFGFIGLTWSVACAIGPVVGGSLASAGAWRWLFYLNLPICGICTVLYLVFLNLRHPRDDIMRKIRRIDWVGNVLVMGSSIAVSISLAWGGVTFSWSSPAVLLPLCLGLGGLVLFLVYEWRWVEEPIVPFILLSNKTSLSGYLQNLVIPVIALAATYYIPVYYQACKGSNPLESGVQTLGYAVIAPASILAGMLVFRTQNYRPALWIGWCMIIIGSALMTKVNAESHIGKSIGFSAILGFGIGFVNAVAQFPVQAALPTAQNGPSMALIAFTRAFSSIWGVSLGNAILQNELAKNLPAQFRSQLPGGVSIVYSTIPKISSLPQPLQNEVKAAFADGLSLMWKILAGLGGLGLVVSFGMSEVPMHRITDENWGMEEKKDERRDEIMSSK